MLREVVERRFDQHFDQHTGQLSCEVNVPLAVGWFAGGEHDVCDWARGSAHQMRHGEFDDSPDTAWPKVIMNDDQLHL